MAVRPKSRDLPHVVIVGYAELMKASRSATNKEAGHEET